MEYLKRIRHHGPVTYTAWTAIFAVIIVLSGISVWSS